MSTPYVCSAKFSGSLDNFIRRSLHKPEKILAPFIRDGMNVLDVGCGPGYFTVGLAGLVGDNGKVIAADIQQEMLDKMLQKVKASGLENRVEAHKCESKKTGLIKKVDFILCFWMVHEVPDQERFFAEMRSLLNPDGRILIVEPKFHVTGKEFNEMKKRISSKGLQLVAGPKIAISRSLIASI